VTDNAIYTREDAENYMFDELMTKRQKREAMILFHRVRIASQLRGFVDPMELIAEYDRLVENGWATDEDPED
jgi:hypothetical protein